MSLNTYGKGDMIFHNFASGQKSAQSVKSDTKLRSCMHNEMKQINMDCSASRSPRFGILKAVTIAKSELPRKYLFLNFKSF